MRLVQAFAALLLTAVLPAGHAFSQADPKPDVIEVRLVAEHVGDGQMMVLEGSQEAVAVGSVRVLSSADFDGVGDVDHVDGQPGFEVSLTPAGARKLKEFSTENVGRTLAIIVDGKLLMTPRIVDPIVSGGFLLTMSSDVEARDLRAKIKRAIEDRAR